jgi:hypothetical protein
MKAAIDNLKDLTRDILPYAEWKLNENGTAVLTLIRDCREKKSISIHGVEYNGDEYADNTGRSPEVLTLDALTNAFIEKKFEAQPYMGNQGNEYVATISILNIDRYAHQLNNIDPKEFARIYKSKRENSDFYPVKGIEEHLLFAEEISKLARADRLYDSVYGLEDKLLQEFLGIEQRNISIKKDSTPPHYFKLTVPSIRTQGGGSHAVCAVCDGKTLVYVDPYGSKTDPILTKDAEKFREFFPDVNIISSDLVTQKFDRLCGFRAISNLRDIAILAKEGRLSEFNASEHLTIKTAEQNMYPVLKAVAGTIQEILLSNPEICKSISSETRLRNKRMEDIDKKIADLFKDNSVCFQYDEDNMDDNYLSIILPDNSTKSHNEILKETYDKLGVRENNSLYIYDDTPLVPPTAIYPNNCGTYQQKEGLQYLLIDYPPKGMLDDIYNASPEKAAPTPVKSVSQGRG